MKIDTHDASPFFLDTRDGPDPDEILVCRAEDAAAGWKENLGLKVTPERILSNWAEIIAWLSDPPKTIRYMDKPELAALRAEIIEAMLAQGTTQERSEELLKSFPTVGDRLGLTPKDVIEPALGYEEKQVAANSGDERLPYLTHNGELVIPYNCPPKYRWWQGGQPIAETRAELTKQPK